MYNNNLKSIIQQGADVQISIQCGNFTFDTDSVLDMAVKRAISNKGFPVGNAFSNYADVTLWNVPSNAVLTGQETAISLIYGEGNEAVTVPLGVFYPEKPKRSGQALSFTAYDKMYYLTAPYVSTLTGEQYIYDILLDLARQGGFQLDSSVAQLVTSAYGKIDISLLYGTQTLEDGTTQTTSYPINECIGYLAGLIGANAQFDRQGKLRFIRFFTVQGYSITDDEVDNVEVGEENKIISYVVVNNENESFISPSDTVKNALSGVQINNPLVTTQAQADLIYNAILPFTYRAVSLRCLTADPALDCGDVIEYSDLNNNEYVMPIMSQKIEYDGAIVSDIQSLADSDNEESAAGSILSRIIAPFLNAKTNELNERINKATESITKAVGGYVSLVDTDGDGIPDNLIAGQYPVDLSANSNWRTRGRCIRINMNGIAVSATGADGPYTDFAVYFDSVLNKYLINADDIAVGTLQGIRAVLNNGSIAGWEFNSDTVYKTVKDESDNDVLLKIGSEPIDPTALVTNDLISIYETNEQGNKLLSITSDGDISCQNLYADFILSRLLMISGGITLSSGATISYADDNGWRDITFSNDFENYSSGQHLKYRKVGNLVEIRGACKPTSTIQGSDIQYVIGTINSQCAPTMNIHTLQQGSQTRNWMCSVNTNGEILFSRHTNGDTFVDCTPSNWLPVHITYLLG